MSSHKCEKKSMHRQVPNNKMWPVTHTTKDQNKIKEVDVTSLFQSQNKDKCCKNKNNIANSCIKSNEMK